MKTTLTSRCHGQGKHKRCYRDTGNRNILYCDRHNKVNKFKVDKNRNHLIRYSLYKTWIPAVIIDLILSFDFNINTIPIGQFRGFNHRVNIVKIISNDKCATGSDDGKIRIWDLHNGKCVKIIEAHPLNVKNILVLSDGKIVSCCSIMLKIWDPITYSCIKKIVKNLSPHTMMSFMVNENMLNYEKILCASGNNMVIWDLEMCYMNKTSCDQQSNTQIEENEKTIICHDSILVYLDVDKNVNVDYKLHTYFPTIITTGANDFVIKIWNRANINRIESSYECINILSGHEKIISFLKCIKNIIYSQSHGDNTFRIWDSKTGICKFILSSDSFGSIKLIAHGDIFGISRKNGLYYLQKWNASSLQKLSSDNINVLKLSPDSINVLKQEKNKKKNKN